LRIWEWYSGLFRAGEFAGTAVEAVDCFGRAPIPYLELKPITVDGVSWNGDSPHVSYDGAIALALFGASMVVAGSMGTGSGRPGSRLSWCGDSHSRLEPRDQIW
jgi:hypothetical protein